MIRLARSRPPRARPNSEEVLIVPIMNTDPFAGPSLMEQRSQGAISTTSHPYLERELAAATRDIRDFCRWHVSPRMQVEYKRSGQHSEQVWLPAMQIATIDAVTIDGTTWDATAFAGVEFDEDTGWTNLRGRRVVVKYTAGYEEVPGNVEAVTLELAATGLGTSLGYTREQAGTVMVAFGRAGGGIDEASPQARRLIAYQIGRLP